MASRLHFRPFLCMAALALAALIGVTALCITPRAWAAPQQKKPAQKTVAGTVVNGSGQPIDKAVVYLQDSKTQIIRSYVTVNGGQFHFNQLATDTDYDVWAEVNKHRSKKKTMSMFSSHIKFTYKLKIKS